ncbi:MAG: hypothetical protein MUF42_04895, partial [Cytophagaceae bacterium]|nr:hypothetical protein [Cytophagaceae bacterium]
MKHLLFIFLASTIAWAQVKPRTPVSTQTVTKPVPAKASSATTTPGPMTVTAAEIASMKKILQTLLDHCNVLNDSTSAEVKKQSTTRLMKEVLSTVTVAAAAPRMESSFWNDYDSLVYAEINPLAYGQKNTIRFYHRLDSSTLTFGKKEYDPWRRFYLCEVQATKIRWYWEKSTETRIDSLGNAVSGSVFKAISRRIPTRYFFKISTDASGKAIIKLLYAGAPGKLPVLAPLPPLQQWWKDLSPEWKNYLGKNKKLEEYPKENDLSRLVNTDVLDLSKSNFKSYQAISAFSGVKKLLLNDCPFANLGILKSMKSLTYLDVSRTNVRSLDSLPAFSKLEEFYCIKNQIVDISPVQSISTLLKLDVSENEIESLQAVRSLSQLKELHLSLNIKIKDLSPISELLLLEKLSLRKIDLSDMSVLRKLNSLVYLDLYSAGITNLQPLAAMKKL